VSSPIIDRFDKLWDEYEVLELVYEEILRTSAPIVNEEGENKKGT
jgi:hypothetical protein